MLRADVDTPQRAMSVQGLIRGTRFIQAGGLGWGVSETPFVIPPDPRVSQLGFHRNEDISPEAKRIVCFNEDHSYDDIQNILSLPPLKASAKAFIRSSAQVAPAPTPIPESRILLGVRVPAVEIITPVRLGPLQVGPTYLPKESHMHRLFGGESGPIRIGSGSGGSCTENQTISIFAKSGQYWEASDYHDVKSLAAYHDWERGVTPLGEYKEFFHTIKMGRKNFKGDWVQNVAVEPASVTVTYRTADNAHQFVIEEKIKIALFGTPSLANGTSDPCIEIEEEPLPLGGEAQATPPSGSDTSDSSKPVS